MFLLQTSDLNKSLSRTLQTCQFSTDAVLLFAALACLLKELSLVPWVLTHFNKGWITKTLEPMNQRMTEMKNCLHSFLLGGKLQTHPTSLIEQLSYSTYASHDLKLISLLQLSIADRR